MLHKISRLSINDKRVVEGLLDRLASGPGGPSEVDDSARRRLTFGDTAANGDAGGSSSATSTVAPTHLALVASHQGALAAAAAPMSTTTTAAISQHSDRRSAAADFAARRSIASLAHNTSRTKRILQDGVGAILERIDLLQQASDERLAAANAAAALALRKSHIAMELVGGGVTGGTCSVAGEASSRASSAATPSASSGVLLRVQGPDEPEARRMARASLQAFASRVGSIVADNVVTSITNSCLVSVEDDESARALMEALEAAVLGRFKEPVEAEREGATGGSGDPGRRVQFAAAMACNGSQQEEAAATAPAEDLAAATPEAATTTPPESEEGEGEADDGEPASPRADGNEHRSPSAERPGRKRRRRERANAMGGKDEMPAYEPQQWLDRLLEMARGNPAVLGGILHQHSLHDRDVRQARVRELRLRTELERARTSVARAEAAAAAAEEGRLASSAAASRAAEEADAAARGYRSTRAEFRQARSDAKAARTEAQELRQQRAAEEAAWQQAAAEAQQERTALREQIDLLRGQLEDGRERESEMQQARSELEQQLRDLEVVRRNLSATIDSRATEARKAEAKLKAQHQREMQQHLQEREATMKRLSKAVRKLKGKQRQARERADRVRQVILAAFGANRPVTAEEYQRCEALFSEMPTGDSDLDQSVDGSQAESLASRTPARSAK